jgi:putative transposase
LKGERRTRHSGRIAWFKHHRLLEPIGNMPPAEAEANYYLQLAESDMIV